MPYFPRFPVAFHSSRDGAGSRPALLFQNEGSGLKVRKPGPRRPGCPGAVRALRRLRSAPAPWPRPPCPDGPRTPNRGLSHRTGPPRDDQWESGGTLLAVMDVLDQVAEWV